MRARFVAVLVLIPLCAGCSNQLTTTTPTTTTGTGTDTFSSFLAVGGTSIHSITVSQAGTIALTLTSVAPLGVVGMGVGVPNASGACVLTNSLDATAAIPDPTTAATVPQLTVPANVGAYCAEVYDSGQLGGIGRFFQVTVAHQ